MLSRDVIESWQGYCDKFFADKSLMDFYSEYDKRRIEVRSEILELLHSYLNQQMETQEFRQTFDAKSRTEWTVFGIKGPSGAMS
jgi:hypothetical protein